MPNGAWTMGGRKPEPSSGKESVRVGKRVHGSLYVHREALPCLDNEVASVVARACRIVAGIPWNVARIDRAAVALLEYEDFSAVAFPRLLSSTLVHTASGRVSSRDHRESPNPPILHRKELLVASDHSRRVEWAALTEDLVARGLFSDRTRIGRRRQWTELLAAAGLDPDGRAP